MARRSLSPWLKAYSISLRVTVRVAAPLMNPLNLDVAGRGLTAVAGG
jgi:hypothetical protein